MRKILFILLLCSGYVNSQTVINSYNFAAAADPIDLSSLLVRLDPTAASNGNLSEDTAIAEWTDLKSGYDATEATLQPQSHVEAGVYQVDFLEANDDHLAIPDANIDLVPGTDEFTIIVKIGHSIDVATNSQCLTCKMQLNVTSSGQYGLYTQSGEMRAVVGGTIIYQNTLDPVAEEIIALVVRTTGADLYRNNTKVADNISIGTNTTTNDLIIGGTYNGGDYDLQGSLEYVLIYNAELTASELTDIYNEIN